MQNNISYRCKCDVKSNAMLPDNVQLVASVDDAKKKEEIH